ncbi:hypothetical protein OPV22_003975 [Ensete ventricosum]|uniref:Uncharacterized protein n=1 Tax=Ensete ventricosum TaxID=4639 RepID=A0AAV8S2A8_ENSVE|nr:hypothetical protein OPV22_003975 [Ensete ventricosum]RWW86785.1 hypothetical protein BHE74_00004412 [Ensete ventricosum]
MTGKRTDDGANAPTKDSDAMAHRCICHTLWFRVGWQSREAALAEEEKEEEEEEEEEEVGVGKERLTYTGINLAVVLFTSFFTWLQNAA